MLDLLPGGIARFHCHMGYHLQGETQLTCLNASLPQWSGKVPTCRGDCWHTKANCPINNDSILIIREERALHWTSYSCAFNEYHFSCLLTCPLQLFVGEQWRMQQSGGCCPLPHTMGLTLPRTAPAPGLWKHPRTRGCTSTWRDLPWDPLTGSSATLWVHNDYEYPRFRTCFHFYIPSGPAGWCCGAGWMPAL